MSENWRDSLPDEIKGEAALANFEDVGALAKGYLDGKAYQGASIKIPGEDAGEDAIKEFNNKLLEKVPTLMPKPNLDDPEQSVEFFRSIGMPEKPDGYETPEFDAPEGFNPDAAKINKIREVAHKIGLTKKQYEDMTKELIGTDAESFKTSKESIEVNKTAIRDQWGHAHDDNMKLVESALNKTKAPEALVASVKEGSATLETLAWLLSVGKQFGAEGNVPAGDSPGKVNGAMAPDDAQAAIDEINNNPQHAYWTATGDEKARAINRMVQLMTWANPESETTFRRA